MKTSSSSGLRLTGILLLSVAAGVSLACADTFRRGGSTTTIEQSGGRGVSSTRVTPYADGRKTVTQDGSSTDIVIQRGPSSRLPDHSREDPKPDAERFDRSAIEEQFSSWAYDEPSSDTCVGCDPSSTREDFKQRMLDRIGNRFSP